MMKEQHINSQMKTEGKKNNNNNNDNNNKTKQYFPCVVMIIMSKNISETYIVTQAKTCWQLQLSNQSARRNRLEPSAALSIAYHA